MIAARHDGRAGAEKFLSNVCVAVRRHGPCRRDELVGAQDVGLVPRAVHEHGVGLGVVDAPRHVGDVLPALRGALPAGQVEGGSVGVREGALRHDALRVLHRDRGQARAPIQRRQRGGGPILVDQRLLRRHIGGRERGPARGQKTASN